MGVNPPGAPVPAVLTEISTNEWRWAFPDDAAMAFHDLQLPHDYAEGTDIVPHIHFIPTVTGVYSGAWTMVFTGHLSAATGEPKEAQLTTTATLTGLSLTAGQMQSIDFAANIPGAGRKISSMATALLSLNLTAAPGSGKLALAGFDGHYQVDSLGSRQILVK
jgi:hypothetical protein